MPAELPFKRGAIELLILKTVSWRPMHGYAIENKGLVESKWGTSENNRQAKYYGLTAEGRRTLRAESESWMQYAAASTQVITASRQPA